MPATTKWLNIRTSTACGTGAGPGWMAYHTEATATAERIAVVAASRVS